MATWSSVNKPSSTWSSTNKPSSTWTAGDKSSTTGYILTDILDYILVGSAEDETLIWRAEKTWSSVNKS